MKSPIDRGSHNRIAELLKAKKGVITTAWFKRLQEKYGDKNILKEQDLFSLLTQIMAADPAAPSKNLVQIIERIRLHDYSISDFVLECHYLEEVIEEVLSSSKDMDVNSIFQALKGIRQNAAQMVKAVLERTADIYGYAVETSGRGFCHVDSKGMIIYANEAMERLSGEESAVGKRLSAFFEEKESHFVQDALTVSPGKQRPGMQAMNFVRPDGKRVFVGVEIAPIILKGQNRGIYATLTDISRHMETQRNVFDRSPLGIIKVDKEQRFIYANPKACEISGTRNLQGRWIKDLLPDERNWRKVKEHLIERFSTGLADEYEVSITRLDNGRQVPVKIAGIPETDLQGNIIGSIAIIRSIALEKANEIIHQNIATSEKSELLFNSLAEEVAKLVPYDLMILTVYSKDMREARVLFSDPGVDQLKMEKRWWKISSKMAEWIRQKEIEVTDNFKDVLARPDFRELQEDPHIQPMLEKRLLSIISYRLIREGKVHASLNLFRKETGKFTEENKAAFEALSLGKAIMAILYLEQKQKLQFHHEAMNEMLSVCDNMEKVADVIVRRLVEHYDWENVSIFQVVDERKIELLSQKARNDNPKFLLPVDYIQGIDTGIMGRVVKEKKEVYEGNIPESKFKDIYREGYESRVISEFCMPIMINDKLSWLLNVEDSHENAFSDGELEELRNFVKEFRVLLDRASLHYFLETTWDAASDAIIVTDGKGEVRQANPAAEKLLGFGKDRMVESAFQKYFARANEYDRVIEEGDTSQEVTLQAKDGHEVPVLLSAAELPKTIGGRVFIAKDLSLYQRVKELEYLDKLYYELAIQTKTPLSLAFSWLRQIKDEETDSSKIDMVDKIIQQLRKVNLTYDRLALYDKREGIMPFNEVLLDMSEVLERLFYEMPETEKNKVEFEPKGVLPCLRGDVFQLTFCLKAILSYLMRFASEKRKISIDLKPEPGSVSIKVRGFLPGLPKEKKVDIIKLGSLPQRLAEMQLGERVIKDFVTKYHKGKYHRVAFGDNITEFQIELPTVREQ